jgi:hypothetical protein
MSWLTATEYMCQRTLYCHHHVLVNRYIIYVSTNVVLSPPCLGEPLHNICVNERCTVTTMSWLTITEYMCQRAL